jgi:hypothetical protein
LNTTGPVHSWPSIAPAPLRRPAPPPPPPRRYNDKAPLENHHLAAAFYLLRRPEYNFLAALPKAELDRFRKLVIDLVLATDMKQHFSILSHFTTAHRLVQGSATMTATSDAHGNSCARTSEHSAPSGARPGAALRRGGAAGAASAARSRCVRRGLEGGGRCTCASSCRRALHPLQHLTHPLSLAIPSAPDAAAAPPPRRRPLAAAP